MKLADINPAEVAAEVVGWVAHQRFRLGMALWAVGTTDPEPAPDWKASDIGLAVHQVAVYARTGTPPEHRAELLPEYLQTIGEALWTGAHPGVYNAVPFPWAAGAGEPTEAIDVVLIAAVARDWLSRDEPVTQQMVAVLAGVSTLGLRNLVSAGELKADVPDDDDGRVRLVAAEEARRWLSARGVPGL